VKIGEPRFQPGSLRFKESFVRSDHLEELLLISRELVFELRAQERRQVFVEL
jgi:hypothetical protein